MASSGVGGRLGRRVAWLIAPPAWLTPIAWLTPTPWLTPIAWGTARLPQGDAPEDTGGEGEGT